MAWRAELVGGELVTRSKPGTGTSVTARVPAGH
jgi:signal transduction histidine kinase